MRPAIGFSARCATVLLVVACFSSVAAAHQDLEEQIVALSGRIDREPGRAELYLQRAELYRVHRDWSAAGADYARCRELAPELAAVDFAEARMNLEAGEPAEALRFIERYLARRPDEPEARALQGRVQVAAGHALQGAAAFSAALASYPPDRRPTPGLYIERSRALKAVGNDHLEEALEGIESGLERLGGPVTLELEALQLEMALGRPDEALERLDRLSVSMPRPEPWMVRKAEVLEASGRLAEAGEAYRDARRGLEALPQHVRSRGGMARLARQVDAALARLEALPARAVGGGDE